MDEPENTLLADDSSDDLENVKTAVRDEEEVKLKETIHFIVSKKCEQESKTSDRKFSREFTYCLADLVYKYAERVARDVEAFSRHAGRKSVRPDDVLLAVRNNDDAVDALAAVMASKGITLPGTKKGKGRKRQRKEKLEKLPVEDVKTIEELDTMDRAVVEIPDTPSDDSRSDNY